MHNTPADTEFVVVCKDRGEVDLRLSPITVSSYICVEGGDTWSSMSECNTRSEGAGGGGGGGQNRGDSLLTDDSTCGDVTICLEKFSNLSPKISQKCQIWPRLGLKLEKF